jgi:hypothetical protein
MTGRTWLDDEPRALSYVGQAVRLVVAGIERPVAFVAAAAACVLVVGTVALLSKASYAPRVVLRIVESARAPAAAPAPPRQLSEYVRQTVFTSDPLLALVHRYELYPSLARKNPRAALDSFREDIDVVAYDNYFLEERAAGKAPRSARLSVAFHGPDPTTALAVTRALAALVTQHATAMRQRDSRRAWEKAEREALAADRVIAARRESIAQLGGSRAPTSTTDGLLRQVELVGLVGSLPALELERDAIEHRATALKLEAALESGGLGMRFEVVDDGEMSRERRDDRAALAAATLLLGLPLVAMAVGAFNPKKGAT